MCEPFRRPGGAIMTELFNYTARTGDAVDIGRFAVPAVFFCLKPFSRVVLRVTADAQSAKNSRANSTAAAKIHLRAPKSIR